MAGTPNYSQEVVDKLQEGLAQVGKDHPDLQKSTAGGMLSKKAFDGIDALQAKIVATEQTTLLAYVADVAKQFVKPGEDPKAAMAEAMTKINATSKAAKSGRLVVGPGTVDFAAELSNKQAYQMMATLLEKYDQLKTNAKSADFEGDLNKTDMAKGSRNDRLALAIAGLVQSAHKILTKDPGYSQFINNATNGALVHDIVSKVKNKDAPAITIEAAAVSPALPSGYSNTNRTPPPLPMFQHKEGSSKSASPEADKKGPTPPPLPPGYKR
jgi:hypothetical protein